MIFNIKNNITRRNINKLTKQYRYQIIMYSILVAVIIALLSIGSTVNWFFRLYPNLDNIANNSFEFHLIDVGESNASAIVFPNNDVLLYDTGDEKHNIEVMTYIDNVLLRRGGSVKYLVISHTDLDHIGNVDTIWDRYKPQYLYLPDTREYANYKYQYLLNSVEQSNSNVIFNYEGVSLEISGVKLTWLSPNRPSYSETNDYSPIILVEYNDYKMLLTGDSGHNIGKDNGINVEAEAISYATSVDIDIDVDVLVAGHHGSKYSTSTLLLDYVKPEKLLISVGDNTYGHPANELYERILTYDQGNSSNLLQNIYTTEHNGNIIIDTIGINNEYRISTINNINSYLFIPYFVIILLALIPTLYLLVRSICIHNYLINYYSQKHTSTKEIEVN